jgi:hypothetical protein
MTIEQTITIPSDRRVHIELTLPEMFESGSTIKFEVTPSVIAVENNPAKNKETMRAALEILACMPEWNHPAHI